MGVRLRSRQQNGPAKAVSCGQKTVGLDACHKRWPKCNVGDNRGSRRAGTRHRKVTLRPVEDPINRRSTGQEPGERDGVLMSQSIEMGAEAGVALAGCHLQALAVPHRDPPVRVANQSGLLQCGGSDADRRPAHTEHDRQKLMA